VHQETSASRGCPFPGNADSLATQPARGHLQANARTCRIQRAPGQAGPGGRRPGVLSRHRPHAGPAGATMASSGDESAAGIARRRWPVTVSDRDGLGEYTPDPPYGRVSGRRCLVADSNRWIVMPPWRDRVRRLAGLRISIRERSSRNCSSTRRAGCSSSTAGAVMPVTGARRWRSTACLRSRSTARPWTRRARARSWRDRVRQLRVPHPIRHAHRAAEPAAIQPGLVRAANQLPGRLATVGIAGGAVCGALVAAAAAGHGLPL